MENKRRNLIIGYDLGTVYSQICWFNEKKGEPESVCVIGSKNVSRIPTVLCFIKNQDGGRWLYGEKAADAAAKGQGTLVSGFLDNYDTAPELTVDGKKYSKKMLTGIFIKESMTLLEAYAPRYTIAYLTVTMSYVSRQMMADIYDICRQEMGVEDHILRVQSHMASYEYYAMSQKPELWQHDVGLFEYTDQGLYYYHMSINKNHRPAVASTEVFPLTMYMSGKDFKQLSGPDLDRKFADVIKEVFSRRIISTVYLAGDGFKGDWMKLSLSRLGGSGRRIFMGDNLYCAGACYSSHIDFYKENLKNFIAASDDIIASSIYLRGTQMKEVTRKEIVQAGECWYRIHPEAEFILDGTDKVVLHVRDCITNKEKLIPIVLDHLPERKNKTVTVGLKMYFENASVCHVTLTDQGFGGLYPASKKTWKQRLNISEYEADPKFREEGRLIFQKETEQRQPYYFNLSDTKVYSLEELCYYMYENIYTITQETFSDELFYWIEKAMKSPEIAKSLEQMKKTDVPLKMLVMQLMTMVDYYNSEELSRLAGMLDEIEHQNPIGAAKIQADNLVGFCRYMEAIKGYMSVIGQMENPGSYTVTEKFKGNTWHNLGCAYMRVMNFASAAVSFKKAYDLNEDERSLKCCLWALVMADDETAFFDAAQQYKLSEKYIDDVLSDYESERAKMTIGQKPTDEEARKVVKRLKTAYRG